MYRKGQAVWDALGSTGPAVLCLSGFASGNWMFQRWLAPLQGFYRFILPENRGMGQAPAATAPYGMDDLAADALRLLDDLGIERCTVIGLSMGGFIAQRVLALAPQRVTGLVLLCTSSGGDAFRPIFPLLSREQVEALYRLDPETRIRAALSPHICPLLQEQYPEVFAEVLQQRLRHPEVPEQVLLQYDAVAEFLRHPQALQHIACPTLILSADQDLLVPVANAALLATMIPKARLQVIANTDHLFFLERAATVSQLLREWLLDYDNTTHDSLAHRQS
ncbi:MAG: alpha/beta hydrolase [Magnetococcales bacterium]|nr:alpha/beta hydrolase [Magnetococcales bacterium]MBF0116184.1 alpha/beta hydrolase [Magnetococcales bacterium]